MPRHEFPLREDLIMASLMGDKPDEVQMTHSFKEDEALGEFDITFDDLLDHPKNIEDPIIFKGEEMGEFNLDESPVYGISFPASMLPIGATSGRWESEAVLDLAGEEDEALVRVWLYPPGEGE